MKENDDKEHKAERVPHGKGRKKTKQQKKRYQQCTIGDHPQNQPPDPHHQPVREAPFQIRDFGRIFPEGHPYDERNNDGYRNISQQFEESVSIFRPG